MSLICWAQDVCRTFQDQFDICSYCTSMMSLLMSVSVVAGQLHLSLAAEVYRVLFLWTELPQRASQCNWNPPRASRYTDIKDEPSLCWSDSTENRRQEQVRQLGCQPSKKTCRQLRQSWPWQTILHLVFYHPTTTIVSCCHWQASSYLVRLWPIENCVVVYFDENRSVRIRCNLTLGDRLIAEVLAAWDVEAW